MAVAFRAYADLSSDFRVNSTINKPTGTADNDALLACLATTIGASVTPPSGWTEFSASPCAFSAGYDVRVYFKRAASEGSSWTWNHSNSQTWGIVVAYSGAIDSGSFIDATPTNNNGNSTSVVALSITVATANSLGVILWTNESNTGGQTPPSGFTEHGNPNSTFGAQDKTLGTGATGNQTTTIVNTDKWFTFFVPLQPLAAADTLMGQALL